MVVLVMVLVVVKVKPMQENAACHHHYQEVFIQYLSVAHASTLLPPPAKQQEVKHDPPLIQSNTYSYSSPHAPLPERSQFINTCSSSRETSISIQRCGMRIQDWMRTENSSPSSTLVPCCQSHQHHPAILPGMVADNSAAAGATIGALLCSGCYQSL